MICPDCEGRGFNYSDPDGKQLRCDRCDGYGEIRVRVGERRDEEEEKP